MAGLTALQIITPSIPMNATTVSVDASILKFVINADTSTLSIDITVGNTTTNISTFTLIGGQNQFTGSVVLTQSVIPVPVEITGKNYVNGGTIPNPILSTPTIQFELIFTVSGLGTQFASPSGISVYKGSTICRVEWAIPQVPGFQGVRLKWSTDYSGVTVPYLQFSSIENTVYRTAQVPVNQAVTNTSSTSTTSISDQPTSIVTNTSTQIVVTVNYDHLDIPYTTVNASVFYVVLTALYQDPNTNIVYESQASGPFNCGFVNLQVVNPTDFLALQRSQDIAARIISNINRLRPELDLTSHAEIRDVFVNPFAIELANMSVREWFSRCAVSISAISQIDDANGDGISDPYNTSTLKQQIAQAYGLNVTTIQPFIDQRFDILGEQAGLTRLGAQAATVELTFYTYSIPSSIITIPFGTVASTLPSSTNTTAVSFATTAAVSINPANISTYYNAQNGWYAVTIPAQATSTGSNTNVGEGTITQLTAGGVLGVSVTNLNPAEFGDDEEANASFAARIQNRQVAGKDTGTRNGYWETAMATPGIINTLVVAAGDLDMLRDWSSAIQRHTFGAVDIYVRGTTNSQQTENVALALPSPSIYGEYSTYLSLKLTNPTALGFQIQGFSSLAYPLYTVIELVTQSAGRTLWLGTTNSQIDNTSGILYLNPNDNVYVINPDGTQSIWQINNVNATNQTVLNSINPNVATFMMMATYQQGIQHIPVLQPIFSIDGITGPITGNIPSSDINLIYTEDFLLLGGSTEANDTVSVAGTTTVVTTKTLTLSQSVVPIDINMALTVDNNGNSTNIISLRSLDLSTVYIFGLDYTIVPSGKYRAYSVNILNQSLLSSGTTQVIAAYYQNLVTENVTFQTDTLTLSGSTPTSLSNLGFIYNIWDAPSHGQTALIFDTSLIAAGVPSNERYIKVVFNGNVMTEGKDFILAVNSPNATLTRITGGAIPDGGIVTVNYYTNEVLTILTEYPAYAEQLQNTLATTKHAGADTLVKAMTPSPVDVVMNVVLNNNTSASEVDSSIRTAIGSVLSNSNLAYQTSSGSYQSTQNVIYQSQIINQVMQIPGVNIQLPLLKCAKADASYVIGQIIPTGTSWNLLSKDNSFSSVTTLSNMYISANVITENTIPSGGTKYAYVGLLYESQAYLRCLTIQQFLNSTVPSFYIIGANDQITPALPLPGNYMGRILISTPSLNPNPASLAYRTTYQVFGAASANDITTASCEYLTAGSISVFYL